jgi:pimeloyl-ACP methyl ester carboxylesterase
VAEWSSGDVVANGIKIHYYRTGGDRPPLVLSHGATDNGLCWTRVARALEAEFDVIMPDARGHGLSDAPEGDYSAAARAADLAGFIAALRLDKPAVGGHSMGAGTTLRLVADYPDVARCAILEDPGFRNAAAADGPPDPEAEARRARARQNAAALKALGREGIIARGRQQRPEWVEEEFGPWADSKLQVSERFSGAARGAERPDWRELLPKVTCPVLLITADPERGGIVTPEMAEEAQRLLPSLQAVRLRGAGHSVHREQFDAFLHAVRTFLAEA